MTFFKMRNLLCWTHKRPIVRPTWLSLRVQVALGEMCVAGLAAAVLVVVGSVRLDNPIGDPSLPSGQSAGSAAGLSAVAFIKQQQTLVVTAAGSVKPGPKFTTKYTTGAGLSIELYQQTPGMAAENVRGCFGSPSWSVF